MHYSSALVCGDVYFSVIRIFHKSYSPFGLGAVQSAPSRSFTASLLSTPNPTSNLKSYKPLPFNTSTRNPTPPHQSSALCLPSLIPQFHNTLHSRTEQSPVPPAIHPSTSPAPSSRVRSKQTTSQEPGPGRSRWERWERWVRRKYAGAR